MAQHSSRIRPRQVRSVGGSRWLSCKMALTVLCGLGFSCAPPAAYAQIGGGGGGGGGGGPEITDVEILSGSEVRITYDLDQNYPTGGGGFEPYAQLLRDEVEVQSS